MAKRFLILALSCSILLSACGEMRTRASKTEMARRGEQNAEVRRIKGGYTQEGIAGWYGKDYYGTTVSSGEKHDLSGMTAAHKTLPLGVYVKVRNKANGREAVVRINSRGPFVQGRIIDLSYASAKRLGIHKRGSAQVRLEALGFRESGPPGKEHYRQPESYEAGTYSVQIKVYSDAEDAKRLAGEMQKLFGYSEIRAMSAGSERYYGVCAGKFSSLKDAEIAERNFAQHGYPASFAFSLE